MLVSLEILLLFVRGAESRCAGCMLLIHSVKARVKRWEQAGLIQVIASEALTARRSEDENTGEMCGAVNVLAII